MHMMPKIRQCAWYTVHDSQIRGRQTLLPDKSRLPTYMLQPNKLALPTRKLSPAQTLQSTQIFLQMKLPPALSSNWMPSLPTNMMLQMQLTQQVQPPLSIAMAPSAILEVTVTMAMTMAILIVLTVEGSKVLPQIKMPSLTQPPSQERTQSSTTKIPLSA